MELLKTRIRHEGKIISDNILKVDSFINHQIDPVLMLSIGKEFQKRFAGEKITKVLTVEASGIAAALMTGLVLEVPVVFAKKKTPNTIPHNAYVGHIRSYTREEPVEIVVQKEYLQPDDRVLIIDDFLATGEATHGLLSIIEQSGAHLVGIGIVVEKTFQEGGKKLREKNIRVESLVRISSLKNGQIQFE